MGYHPPAPRVRQTVMISFHSPIRQPGRLAADAPAAFTLIEVIVVIAVIGLLIGIILPSVGRARATSKVSVCASNLRQVAIAIQQYAMDNRSFIPVGPSTPMPFNPARTWPEWASNQVWIGGILQENGLGLLVPRYIDDPRVLFCPGSDEPEDMAEELPRLAARGPADAFCSYLYRQLDETTRPSFDDLGTNSLGLVANALAMDVNSLGFPRRTHHGGTRANVVFRDSHVLTVDNARQPLTLRGMDFAGFPGSVDRRLDAIFCAADYAENGNPDETPPLP